MKYLIFNLFVFYSLSFGQITGLEGWDIYIDPGHSQRENMGVYGYSEAERNLRVGLRLREMLINETDIDTVFICRTNDTQQVSLSQRSGDANTKGTSWYHSIHSDAGASTYNSTLLLHGGWRQNGETVEKTPHGGKEMGDYMVDLLTRGMRISTRGNYADRTFYQGFPDNHTNKYPYLHVNRETSMPSELSESGFHTNPKQNQLFMNDDWKLLEARTFFWSILKYHNIQRPIVRILTGNVKDKETNIRLNGAEIHVENRTYTTDTYESLFYKYNSDPDLLHNGFYYFEEIINDEVEIIANAEGYYSDTLTVSMVDTFFTFVDFNLISTVLPVVISTYPADGDTSFPAWDPIVIQFSRPMDTSLTKSAVEINPLVPLDFNWNDTNMKMQIISDSLDYLTAYTLTITGEAQDAYGHLFDGNGNGVGGDEFVLNFSTGSEDMTAPRIESIYPKTSSSNIELHPVINIEFDEELDSSSVTDEIAILEYFEDHSIISTTLKHFVVNERSVICLFPDEELIPNKIYVTRIYAGLKDLFGNTMTNSRSYSFRTCTETWEIISIDNFDSGLTTNWMDPQFSGSTVGKLDNYTSRSAETAIINYLTQSTTAMKLCYGWDMDASQWLIREYLGGGAPRNVTFDKNYVMQVYVFGDGSGNKFRFAVDDNYPNDPPENHEVSPWHIVDWIGWKLVSWDMSSDGTGTWIGDGNLDGTLRFDSIQLTYNSEDQDVPNIGQFYFDDLRIVTLKPVGIEPLDETLPKSYTLEQNYPNPFNPTTTIGFSLLKPTHIRLEIYNLLGKKIRTLVDEHYPAGHWSVTWNSKNNNGQRVPSGVYFYYLYTPNCTLVKRMMLLK